MTIAQRAKEVACKFMALPMQDRNETQLQELVSVEFERSHAAEMRRVPVHKRDIERIDTSIDLWTHYTDLVRREAEKAGYSYTA